MRINVTWVTQGEPLINRQQTLPLSFLSPSSLQNYIISTPLALQLGCAN